MVTDESVSEALTIDSQPRRTMETTLNRLRPPKSPQNTLPSTFLSKYPPKMSQLSLQYQAVKQ